MGNSIIQIVDQIKAFLERDLIQKSFVKRIEKSVRTGTEILNLIFMYPTYVIIEVFQKQTSIILKFANLGKKAATEVGI